MIVLKHLRVLICCGLHVAITDRCKLGVSTLDKLICDKSSLESLETKMLYKPLFSSKIVVDVYLNNVDAKTIKILERYIAKYEYVQFIFLCAKKSDYDKLEVFAEKKIMLDFNPYRLKKDYLLNYILSHLNQDIQKEAYAEAIFRRLNNSYQLLDDYINVVNGYEGKLSERKISLMLPKVSRISIDSAFRYSLLGKEKKEVFAFINRFRAGHRWLRKEYLNRFDLLIKYYIKYLDGEYNQLNIKEFISKDKEVGYELYWFLKIYEMYSLEYLIYAQERLRQTKVTPLSFEQFVLYLYEGVVV